MRFCVCSLIGYVVIMRGSEEKKKQLEEVLIGEVDVSIGNDNCIWILALHFPDFLALDFPNLF